MQEKCQIYEALKACSIVIKNRITLLAQKVQGDRERPKCIATLQQEIKMLEVKLKNIKVNKYVLVYHGEACVYCYTRRCLLWNKISYQQCL